MFPMNDELTPERRARALELYRLHFRLTHDYESATISPDQLGDLANAWLAVEEHVLKTQHLGHPAGGTWWGATNDPGVDAETQSDTP